MKKPPHRRHGNQHDSSSGALGRPPQAPPGKRAPTEPLPAHRTSSDTDGQAPGTDRHAGALEMLHECVTSAFDFDFAQDLPLVDTIEGVVDDGQALLSGDGLRALAGDQLGGSQAVTVMSSLLEGTMETFSNTKTMSSWESILFAAYLSQQVDKDWIKRSYEYVEKTRQFKIEIWKLLNFSFKLPAYRAPGGGGAGGGNGVVPRAGQVLFFYVAGDFPEHIAVSLGGDQAISLWNQPNGLEAVQRISIREIDATRVYVGDPPW